MIDAQTYLEHIRRDGDRIAEVSEGNLEKPVPSCPGNTVGSLLLHTAAVCMFWADALTQNKPPESDWTSFPTDPLKAQRTMHGRVVRELAARNPDQPTWTWAGQGTVRFAYRRVAQELAVHKWDFQNAIGDPHPIDAELSADGIDEFLVEFGTSSENAAADGWKSGSELYGGDGETFRVEATDFPSSFTFVARPDRFDFDDSARPDVTARGTASDLLLFLWGRIPPTTLNVSGDASLLERWQERVKI